MRYTEQYGRTPFNWNEFLNKGNWSQEELLDAYVRSARWVTCAVGNQCASIPRDGEGKPFDRKLRDLGMKFYDCINRAVGKDLLTEIENAKSILIQIEKRSEEIIRDHNEIKT